MDAVGAVLVALAAAVGILFAVYVLAAFLLLTLALRVARSQDDDVLTLDCRDGVHTGCATCDCPCHV